MLRQGSVLTGIMLTSLVAFGPISTDLYLPSLPAMTRAFDTDVAEVQLTLSVFIAGFAAGQLIYGPLSDRFGRRPALIGGVLVYFLASVACTMAESIAALIGLRFVQALGAAAGPVLGRAIVRDLFAREEAARVLSFMGAAMALAPGVAPIIGGQLQALFGWQSSFVALAVFGGVVLLGAVLAVQETNQHRDPYGLHPGRMAANYLSLLRHRSFVGYTLVAAAGFSGLFAFISGASFVVIDVLGVPAEYFGFCFAAVVIGFITGSFSAGRLARRVGIDRLIALGCLGCALSGSLLAALALAGVEHIAALIGPMSVYFASVGLSLPPATAGAVGPFPHMAGAASAMLGFLQLGAGALAGLVVGRTFDGTAVPMASTVAVMGISAFVVYVLFLRPARQQP